MRLIYYCFFLVGFINIAKAQTLPSSIVLKDITGGTFTMGDDTLVGPADQLAAEHTVTVSNYSMSEAEITNAQYVEFLNAAFWRA